VIGQLKNNFSTTIWPSLKLPKGGNQNLYFKGEQTTQWPKEKVPKDKQ
jgi:hypothetical protein